MKSHVVGIALLAFAAGCTKKDTTPEHVWPRAVEPRVTAGTTWQPCQPILRRGSIVDDVRCDTAALDAECDENIRTQPAAVRAVAFRSRCLDAAIGVLQSLSRRDAGAMSDLAAAYYVRAQRDDRAPDLLHALDAAEQAAAIRPVPSGASFNLALTREAAGLTEDAIAAWNEVIASDAPSWRDEARRHRDALLKRSAGGGERQWQESVERIKTALQASDANAIEKLIAPFPATSQKFFDEQVLPRWAADPSPEHLANARLFATALSRTLGDRYPLDVADAAGKAHESPAKLAALQRGTILFRRARDLERALQPDAAAKAYASASQLLKSGGSPLYLSADIGLAASMTTQEGPRRPILQLLERIENAAGHHGYERIAARAMANRANVLGTDDRLIEAAAVYDEVFAEYQRWHDQESLASTEARRIGILRSLGQNERAWRDALPTLRNANAIVDQKTHHLLGGECAALATALGCPRSALAVMNAEVRHFQARLASTPPDDKVRLDEAKVHVAIARRSRARIEVQLQRYVDAQQDLDEAIRLTSMNRRDPSARNALEARLQEVEGEALLHIDPLRAAAAFAKARDLSGSEYVAFRASVSAERANALRAAGRSEEAETDMRAALADLRAEEAAILEQRSPASDVDWNEYFGRFQQTYDLLIRQLVDENRSAEAFGYAEKARAQEPLNLVLRGGTAPRVIQELAKAPAETLLLKLEAQIPAGTFLIEYRVLGDRTYVWVVTHNASRFLSLRARGSDVNRWTAALQEAAEHRDSAAFAGYLYSPYAELLSQPVAAVDDLSGHAANVRLVVVPDRALYGLPFAALHDPESHQYLIQRGPVAIAGSAVLYLYALMRDAQLPPRDRSALLIGDPAFDPRLAGGLPRLPAARREVERIRDFYAPGAEEWAGENATTTRFLKSAGRSAIIHIAAHGIVNADAQSQSFLLLAPSGEDSGVLDAQTLMKRLTLDKTRLVVLAACSSGGGVAVGPEGVAPLVRPFVAAHVPGVVGALWGVNDATAEDLLVSFHRRYHEGSDAALALQAAQLEMLTSNNPGLRSELAWAPFQVIGYASSPFAPARSMKKEKPP